MQRHYLFALLAPAFWSISGVTVRLMESADHWQINCYRSASLALFVFAVLLFRYRLRYGDVLRSAGGMDWQLAVLSGWLWFAISLL